MTTIAYNHKDKQISVDGRLTDNNVISSDSWEKWYVHDGVISFAAGCLSDIALFIASYSWGEKASSEFGCSVIQVDDGEVFLLCASDGEFKKYPIKYNDAIGSGRQFALSAMDFGCSSAEAVAHAATKDINTGGKISTYDIATKSFA